MLISVSAPHALPLSAAAPVRKRERNPPPHDCVHAPHAPHAATTQPTGHGPVAHERVSWSGGHFVSPATATTRLRVCVPPPHVTVHVLQRLNVVTVQGTGQSRKWHGLASVSAPHALPPARDAESIERRRCAVPAPQEAEHASHPPQLPTTQSSGHVSLEQLRVAKSTGQPAPPCAAAVTTERARVCDPPPHDVLHAPHPPQPLTAHATGHSSSWQSLVSESAGHVPPNAAGTSMARKRVVVLAPHEATHAVQLLHGLTVQSRGHGFQPCGHCVSSTSSPQAAPKAQHGWPVSAGRSTARDLWRMPGPHVDEQGPKVPHAPIWQSHSPP